MHTDENYQSLSLLFNMQGILSTLPKIYIFKKNGSLSKINKWKLQLQFLKNLRHVLKA